jgi:hypothetical protein
MRFLAIVVLLLSASVNAAISEAGKGMLFGQDHAFAVTATMGWVLDNESGVESGLHMVFYPKGETWSGSPVIIYGRAISTKDVASAKQQVEKTVSEFQREGSSGYTSTLQLPIRLEDGRRAELYYFSGDQWGNYEAAAYFQEVDTLNYLVFNSRTKADFDKYLGDFIKIVRTYQNLYAPVGRLTNEKFENLKRESRLLLSKPHGKEYESKAVQAVGQTMANAMRDCTAYMPGKELPAFDYFVRINKDGGINEASVFPTYGLSTCFSGLMSGVSYPAHNFGTFVLNIEMKVTP